MPENKFIPPFCAALYSCTFCKALSGEISPDFALFIYFWQSTELVPNPVKPLIPSQRREIMPCSVFVLSSKD